MKNFIAFALVAFLLLGAKLSLAGVVFYDDAEDAPNTSSDWVKRTDYGSQALSVSSEQSRAGNKSYKFVYSPSKLLNSGTRTELTLRGLKAPTRIKNFAWNQEYWMGYSIYIPKDFSFPDKKKGEWGLLGQFHGVNDSCEKGTPGPLVACYLNNNTNAFDLSIKATDNLCYNGNLTRHQYYRTPVLKKGAWNDIVMNFKFNYVNSGNPFFKMWMNGQLIADDKGPNCYNDKVPPYFKMGIYSRSSDKITVYYDEIRVGNQNSSYNDVAPQGGGGGSKSNVSSSLNPPTLRLVPNK